MKLTSSEQKAVLPGFQSTMTHCSLSWGLALRFPLITEAGSRRECSQIEFAPLLYNVWTIWSEMKKKPFKCVAFTDNELVQLHDTLVTWTKSMHLSDSTDNCCHERPREYEMNIFLLGGRYLELCGGPRCVRQVADMWAVSAQTSMNAAALITNQHTPVHGGPAGLWEGEQNKEIKLINQYSNHFFKKN